jgi:hypothetical protein
MHNFRSPGLSLLLAMCLLLLPSLPLIAADHADSPNAGFDRAADIADLFAFVDPNDATQVDLILTFAGFIVPGENNNFGTLDPNVRYRFSIENTGDATPDKFIDVFFDRRTPPNPQMASITLPDGTVVRAPVTNPSNTADTSPTPTVTTDAATGVTFFAGLADDPFFFDIPAFSRFIASVNAGSPDATVFERGRDTFAGYNVQAIALRLPAAMLRGSAGNTIGVAASTSRRQRQILLKDGTITGQGKWVAIDRMGNPAVNVALIPFARKNEYNVATTDDDANGRFADDIIATLTHLGTDQTHIGILANVAVLHGDFLRLDTSLANTGPGGGNNAGAGYPNGRRLADDTIDIILTIIANGAPLGDNVNANDMPLRDAFPYLAGAQQPRVPGTLDDSTRN